MLTQPEFDALLQRYLAGRSRPGERQQVEQWSEQLGREENLLLHPNLQAEVKTAMGRRIQELTAEGAKAAPIVVPFRPKQPAFWREPALRWAAAAVLTLGVGAAGWLPQHRRRGFGGPALGAAHQRYPAAPVPTAGRWQPRNPGHEQLPQIFGQPSWRPARSLPDGLSLL